MNSKLLKTFMVLTIFLVGTICSSELSAQNTPKKIKIPHNHSPMEGGLVYQLGDDHFEFKFDGKEKTQIFASDKFRDPLSFQDLEMISLTLVEGSKSRSISLNFDSKRSNVASFSQNLHAAHGATLEFFAKRKQAPKGHISAQFPVKIKVMDFMKPSASDPHAGHH